MLPKSILRYAPTLAVGYAGALSTDLLCSKREFFGHQRGISGHRLGLVAFSSTRRAPAQCMETEGPAIFQAVPRPKPLNGSRSSPVWKVLTPSAQCRTVDCKQEFAVRCNIARCTLGGNVFWERQSEVQRCWQHILFDHNFENKQTFSDHIAREGQLQALLSEGRDRRPVKTRKRARQRTPSPPAGNRGILPKILPQSTAQRKLTKSYVRNVVVGELQPIPKSYSAGELAFLKDLSTHCGCTMVWPGLANTSGRRCLEDDLKKMWSIIDKDYREVYPWQAVLHHDGWKDPFKRPFLGITLTYINRSWQARHLAFGLRQLGSCLKPKDPEKMVNRIFQQHGPMH